LLVDRYSENLASLVVVTPLLNVENHSKNLCPSHLCSPKSCFQHFICFRIIFPQLKAKSDKNVLFFQVGHFKIIQKFQME
jgi:hypothetical protein